MPDILEENRFLYLESRLGPNELLLESFTGTEGISELFSFQLELLSENRRIKFEDILGQEITFGIMGPEGNDDPRHIHGIVTAFTQFPDAQRLSRYRAVVAPKLWVLTQRQNCRIFQNLTTPDILKQVLTGIDVVWELRASYEKRNYCVQYRETDFNFMSRLMEEEGIFYFFRHSKSAHKLVIADNKASHHDIPGNASLIYDDTAGGVKEEARISSWMKTQELGPGKFSLQDYSFETPSANLAASKEILPSTTVGKVTHKLKIGGNDQFEIYGYPGGYEKKSRGEIIATNSMQQLEMAQFTICGESNSYQLIPGYRFNLTRHPNGEGSYVITSVSHSASEGSFLSGDGGEENPYSNTFYAMPFSLAYRPRPSASRPHVWGCHTAVVVGPAGEEIYTDKYGRVKVQFHWDREPKNDSNSCWIRFGTPWAGKGWGTIHIPRIGQEVIVEFLEGNPDQPIIVGSVYNSANMPPFPLPGDKTKSGIKSESSKGGGGYNQIVFEDLKGSEDIIVHAQKDMNVKVENDRNTSIGKDDTVTIGDNYDVRIGKKTNINSGNEIVLETGASKIVMKKSGLIEITGTKITVSATAALKTEGGTIDSAAKSAHTITGAIVKIN